VVGHAAYSTNIASSFFYSGTPGHGGQMTDLKAWLDANNPTDGPKWYLSQARSLSNTGWVTGFGNYDADGPGGAAPVRRAYLLDASSLVPEPGTFSVVVVGAGWSLIARRQRALGPRKRGRTRATS
jgi:hypothetical protein